MGADPRLALASGVALTAIACAIWLGGLNLYAAQLRGGAAIADTDARTSAEGLPQAAVVLDAARQARQEPGRAARQTGFVVGRRLLPLARHGRPCPSPPTASRACPTPTTPLTLTLADAGEQAQRVAETPALVQQAAALGRNSNAATRTPPGASRPPNHEPDRQTHASWRASQQRYALPPTAPAKAGRRWRHANAAWSCAPAPCWAPRWPGRC